MVGNSSPAADPSETIAEENKRSSDLIANLIQRNAHIPSDVLYDRGSFVIESCAKRAHDYIAAEPVAEPVAQTFVQKASSCIRWVGRLLAGPAVEATRAVAHTVLSASAIVTYGSAQFIAAEGSAPLAEKIITPAIIDVKGKLLNPEKIDAIIREVLKKIPTMLAQ